MEAKVQEQPAAGTVKEPITQERNTETRRSRPGNPKVGGEGETDRTSVEVEKGPDVFRMRTNTINEILVNREMYINNYESKRDITGNDFSPGALDHTPQTLGNSLPVEGNSGVNLHDSMSEETRASVVGNGAVAVTTATEVKSASKIIFEAFTRLQPMGTGT